MTWRDISTAPRDGTRVLLWPSLVAGYWMNEREYWVIGETETEYVYVDNETHWQPLPAPPVTTPEAERLEVMEGK